MMILVNDNNDDDDIDSNNTNSEVNGNDKGTNNMLRCCWLDNRKGILGPIHRQTVNKVIQKCLVYQESIAFAS